MDELNELSWGIRLNPKSYGYSDLDAPAWVLDSDCKFSWFSDGLVIWDEKQKIVVNLSMWGAMAVLDQMLKSSLWKTQGQEVAQKYGKFNFSLSRKRRKKANMPDEANLQDEPKVENVLVQLHLDPKQAESLFGFLKSHEKQIRSDGNSQKWQFENGIKELARLLVDYQRRTVQPIPVKEKPDNYDFSI